MSVLTDEQKAIIQAVRDFSESALAPHAIERDETHHFPVDMFLDAAELGLGGVYVTEEDGGAGLSRVDAAIIFEELAKGDPSLAAYISIHNMVVWMIDAYGTPEQQERWLPRLISMEDLASYCLTEPGAGSDAAALTTTAVRDGDDYVLNGVKQFISGAGVSGAYVVMARTGGEGPRGISSFIVPGDAEGLSFGAEEKKMGWRAQPTRAVMFDDVRVPAANLLGAEGEGFTIAMKGLNGGRINVAACALGGAQWTLERTLAYVQERHAFGKPLAANQSILFTLADMDTTLQAARLMIERGADAIDRDDPGVAAKCAQAKQFATDIAFDVANSALQLHGGYGYLSEYGIEKVVRDLRVHQILEGTNEIMRLIVGRSLLDDR